MSETEQPALSEFSRVQPGTDQATLTIPGEPEYTVEVYRAGPGREDDEFRRGWGVYRTPTPSATSVVVYYSPCRRPLKSLDNARRAVLRWARKRLEERDVCREGSDDCDVDSQDYPPDAYWRRLGP